MTSPARTMRIGYVMVRYPLLSLSFIATEVAALRARGHAVVTLAVHRTPERQLLSRRDRDEAAGTFTVLPFGMHVVRAHARALARNPWRYLSTFVRALRLAPGGLRGLVWQTFYFAEAVVVAERARAERLDHLHAHFTGPASHIALLAARLLRRPWSVTVHGPDEFYDVRRLRLGELAASAAFVATVSHFGRSQMLVCTPREHHGRIHVVGCGFDPEVFARPAAPATDGAPPLLAVGRLVRAKGFDQMLEAVALLRREGEPTRAVIVGDGPERDGLEALAARLGVQDLVTFAGAVGHDEIRRFYADARIVCVPSLAEGLPVVLMEAMAVGRPVVATRITGVPELVEDGVSGLLVTPGRPRELAAALRALLTDPAMRERLSEAGRAKVLQDHDVGRSAERLERLFMDPAGLSS